MHFVADSSECFMCLTIRGARTPRVIRGKASKGDFKKVDYFERVGTSQSFLQGLQAYIDKCGPRLNVTKFSCKIKPVESRAATAQASLYVHSSLFRSKRGRLGVGSAPWGRWNGRVTTFLTRLGTAIFGTQSAHCRSTHHPTSHGVL